MPKGYHHLTYEQRCQLYTLNKRGESKRIIANELGVSRATIYRELARNSGQRGYRYKQAHEKACSRRKAASGYRKKMSFETINLIESRLQQQWSPDQISGWMKLHQYEKNVSHETIYKFIWTDKRRGGSLYKHLRHSGKKYNKRRSGKAGRGCIPGRVDIDQRPAVVEEKSRLGDWELDTIIGKEHKGAIVSMVDRGSKLTKLCLIPRKSAVEVEQALVARLGSDKSAVLTLTADNGKEFANHHSVSHALEAGFYFAKPYHSWERGLNEHTNGLVRQYLPKSTRFDEISQLRVHEIEILLNNRPRKILGYLTPIEAFNKMKKRQKNLAL